MGRSAASAQTALRERICSFVTRPARFVCGADRRALPTARVTAKIAAYLYLAIEPAPGTAIATRLVVRLREIAMSMAGLALLLALIVLADERVRDRLSGVTTYAVSHHLSEETARAESTTAWVRDLATENGALTLVVLAGGVLFICMLRT